MQKILFIISILIVLGFQKHETQINYTNHPVMKYLRTHTDEGYCIMLELLGKYDDETKTNGETHSPSEYLELFFKDATTTLDSIRGVGTLIHEATHRLRRYDYHMGYYYYLSCNRNLGVKHTNTFESRKMVEIIPDSCRTFRFDSYIRTKANHSTQVHGIYGLLSEFNAYYHESQSQYDFKSDISDHLYLEGVVRSGMSAYFEFKYYILTYLIYAEKNYSAQFNAILDNRNFTTVYRYIDTNFGTLVHTFMNDGNTISMKEKGDIRCLINVLQTPEYQKMIRRINE